MLMITGKESKPNILNLVGSNADETIKKDGEYMATTTKALPAVVK